MKIPLAAILFAATSFPVLGQQTPPTNPPDQPTSPAATSPSEQQQQPTTPASKPETPADSQGAAQSTTQGTTSDTQASQTTTAQAPVAEMRPVNGALVSKLDSSTAKTGDDVVLQTESSVKTADGTEIPKGSKIVGKVLAVRPSAGQNSQVALRFDHAELKDGKSLPIQSEIQSVAPAAGEASSSAAESMPRGGPAAMPGMAGSTAPGTPGEQPGAAAAAVAGAAAGAAESTSTPGTIVSRNGNIAIRTTSIPGILLANNAPGQQDPRMSQASGFILGTNKDVQLDGGTKMVVMVATTAGPGGQ
jgi:hypothetical protein